MKKPSRFNDEQVNLKLLRERAFNLRWATLPEDVIPLTAADPDFPIATEIRDAIKDYTDGGVFSYGPPEGLKSFRKSAARVLNLRKGIPCTSNEIIPVNSAAFGMYLVAKTLLEKDDEAIIFDPVDFLFKKTVEMAGGKAVLCPVDRQTGSFRIEDLEALVTPKTKMIGFCNPHNPLGRIYSRKELRELAKFAIRHDLWVMSDEIWSDIVYEKKSYISIASIDIRIALKTITVYGFSKSFGLAGLRAGLIIAPHQDMYNRLYENSQMQSTAFGMTTISQIAAQTALDSCWYWVDEFVEHLKSVRDYAVERLNNMEGVSCNSPQATYVLFPNITAFGMTSEQMTEYLLKEAKVAVVPGASKWFGPGAEGHIRICFSTSHQIIKEALDRIENALSKLWLKGQTGGKILRLKNDNNNSNQNIG